MAQNLTGLQRRIIALARHERGDRTREELFGTFNGISPNTYANFETGRRWPRARTARQIESLLGWQGGIIEDVIASGIDPDSLTLEHMRGSARLGPATGIAVYSTEELIAELLRRQSGDG